jgi:hypothetical protein
MVLITACTDLVAEPVYANAKGGYRGEMYGDSPYLIEEGKEATVGAGCVITLDAAGFPLSEGQRSDPTGGIPAGPSCSLRWLRVWHGTLREGGPSERHRVPQVVVADLQRDGIDPQLPDSLQLVEIIVAFQILVGRTLRYCGRVRARGVQEVLEEVRGRLVVDKVVKGLPRLIVRYLHRVRRQYEMMRFDRFVVIKRRRRRRFVEQGRERFEFGGFGRGPDEPVRWDGQDLVRVGEGEQQYD